MQRFLYRLNLKQALTIVLVPTIGLITYFLLKQPFSYQLFIDFAGAATVYFLLAFLLYPLLLGVKHLRFRWLVKFTRIYIRFHIATAIGGTVLLLPHITGMPLYASFSNPKALTGLLTICTFSAVLVSGYFRKKRSSGKRRRYHRYSAFIFIGFLFVHLVI
ncbi:hypothetical protein ACE1TI_05240 [Alteribacillus sp. JSM 102045]|uniref:hypothetical protein n=1 Tax=Alteribacillus sp. JSM 102045 TaxID=1562101 RepID=UPI0035BF378F